MSFSHVVYIDEAGDEGFGKLRVAGQSGQSMWLLLGAAIIRGENDTSAPAWRNEIMGRFPNKRKRDIHFRNFNHEQKIVISQEIAARPIFSCVTFSNKTTIPGSQYADVFKRPGYLYNFMTRWLLERVTSFCERDADSRGVTPCRVKVVFSRRSGTNYEAMREYMELMRDGREAQRPIRSIRWNVFNPSDILVENHSKWAGLQLADCITSAYFSAVEPNGYGNTEASYAEILRPLAICNNGIALNVGVTPVPSLTRCQANRIQAEFFRSFAQ